MTRARLPILLVLALGLLTAAPAHAATLRAGAGRADITPQTGYYLGGWTRADRLAQGQHTRLYARAIVLKRGGQKVALVSIDLFMTPGGMVHQIGQALAARGFSERNVLISATHTHSGPGGYGNFPELNTAAPSLSTVTDPFSYVRLISPLPADPLLYTFLTRQITKAIARADSRLAPARAGWGYTRLLGLTKNRSLEAHLADHGIIERRGTGSVAQDPEGYVHTIDPDVNVLRVDRIKKKRVCHGRRGHRRCRTKRVKVPLGAWTNFADHGTVTKSSFQYYNADHFASADRVFERAVRKRGKVPPRAEVVNVFASADEGDQSAGLDRNGPAASDQVGRVEASAMLGAWRQAGRSLSSTPKLSLRWTRACFCGQTVPGGGKVASSSQVGIPFLTGSEEERGPLYDVDHVTFEDYRSPIEDPVQGDKYFLPGVGTGGVPHVIPLTALRIGSRVMVSVPGESTREVGARIKAAVAGAMAGSGIRRVVISGLTNEFILYITTPQEYERQHYEGGNTHFGKYESLLVVSELAKLAGTLARGAPAPAATAFDATNGVRPNGPSYSSGAAHGTTRAQPARFLRRLSHATFSWHGGAKGLDRPVDKPFITAQRLKGGQWQTVENDLGLTMVWTVDGSGNYKVSWEIPRDVPRGRYRLVVTAKRYHLTSRPFRVIRNQALKLEKLSLGGGKVAVRLAYPAAVRDVDITWRPPFAQGGQVKFRVGGRTVTVKRKRSTIFSLRVPAGAKVTIPAGAARDRDKNVALSALSLQG